MAYRRTQSIIDVPAADDELCDTRPCHIPILTLHCPSHPCACCILRTHSVDYQGCAQLALVGTNQDRDAAIRNFPGSTN